jgi:acetoin utilization protein AcuB
MREPTIRQYMTESPLTIAKNQTLASAHKIMRENGIRHLPVLEQGKLVGIVSQHDLHFIETLLDVDTRTVKVEEAMTPDPFHVPPGAHLPRVLREMADHRYSSAVVMDKGTVVGILTTVDALRAAADAWGKEPRA